MCAQSSRSFENFEKKAKFSICKIESKDKYINIGTGFLAKLPVSSMKNETLYGLMTTFHVLGLEDFKKSSEFKI